MEAAPVCSLADAMFRLPAKLNRLLTSHGHTLPRGVQDEIPLIKQDLEKMIVFLQAHDHLGAEDCGMMVKCLTKEVRELSYDMEDSIDQYEHAADSWRPRGILSPRPKKYKITRRKSKNTNWLHENLKWRLWMANKIREFSMRSQEAIQRCSLFDLGSISSNTAATSTRCSMPFGSWHPTLYREPVGIGAPMKKLEAWLTKDGDEKLKVVSLVGCGGIGKTTLANELYRRIGGKFECQAFVRTSRKPDMRRLLIGMLSQVRPHHPPQTCTVHSLITEIKTHLQDKRYLIVIDDVCETETWDMITRALPDGTLRSGVLITTEIEGVALKCCCYDSKFVFAMEPLSNDDSRKLFFYTAFGPKYGCPPELSEVANNIIRKCNGLPLAMVCVASLLFSQMGKPERWDYVHKSLCHGLRTNPTSEGMTQILNLSFNNLPQHLKVCVMYLSIYEEDYIIQKDDLVKQWIAEGFIRETEEKDKEEISKGYFDELICRRIIQPVQINDNGDILSCSVHQMILDFVAHKSIEENFVTAIDHGQTTARLSDKVRRLSLHFGNAEAASPTNMRLSQVRTLAFFGVFKSLPSIVEFGLLQVLILQLWVDAQNIDFDLTRISELFRLRYLHVTCNATLQVPQTHMRGLQYLETLKIDARVSEVPSDIVHLPGLLHLSIPVKTYLPNGIGLMTSLRTLGYFDVSVNSTENMQSLGELTSLRDLRLTCSTKPSYPKSNMDYMSSILAKLSKLRSLILEPSSTLDVKSSSMNISCDTLSIISSPPALLQRFEWLPRICTFSSLPKWIGHLDKLCILKIGVSKLASNDVDVLRGLPALTVLSLCVRTKPAKRIVFNKTGFSVLKYCKFRCSVPWLEFEVDAMPNLRRLKLGFDAHGMDQHVTTIPIGIEHLSGLKEISAKIGGAGADDPVRTAAESALSYAIKMHPAHPTFNIQHVDWMFTSKDDYNSSFQEEQHMTLQKQYDIMEEDSTEQHQVLHKDSREGRRMPKVKKTRMRRVMQVKVGSVQDGFSWRKYGQKNKVLGSKYPRAYFKCVQRGCPARKHVQCTDIDPLLVDVTYEGEHTCAQSAHSLPQHRHEQSSDSIGVNASTTTSESQAKYHSQFGHEQSSVSVRVKPEGSAQGLEHMPPRMPKLNKQMRRVMQVKVGSVQDGFSWRKYGQKEVLGSKYPRAYFKCVQRGCPARKHVQRTDIDPLLVDVAYEGEHTCAQGAHSLPQHRQEQSSDSIGVNASTATSESQVNDHEISGSVTGVRFMSPLATSGSHTTSGEASETTSTVEFMSLAAPNWYEAASGSGSGSSTGSRRVSPAVSESLATYNVVIGSTAGSWSAPVEADSAMDDDLVDLDAAFDDYAEIIDLNPAYQELDVGSHAPPNSPKSSN